VLIPRKNLLFEQVILKYANLSRILSYQVKTTSQEHNVLDSQEGWIIDGSWYSLNFSNPEWLMAILNMFNNIVALIK